MASKYEMSEIIDESIKTYRKNFKLLYILSLSSAALSGVYAFFNKVINTNDNLNFIVLILLAIGIIYLSLRIQITLILTVNHLLKNEEFSAKECFQQSSNYFWNYLSAMLGIILIILLPTLIITFTVVGETDLIVKLLVGLIFGIVILAIVFYLNFAPLSSVLLPNSKSYLSTSFALVKTQPLLVLSMLGLGILVQMGLYFVLDLLVPNLPISGFSLGQFIEILINALIAPLMLIFYILVFKHLVSMQKATQEVE